MQTYIFNASVESHASGKIFTASNGEGFIEDNALHVKQSRYHFIYKFDGDQVGWFMRNSETREDVFLGEGASPSAEYDGLTFEDEEYFNSITHSPESTSEAIEE